MTQRSKFLNTLALVSVAASIFAPSVAWAQEAAEEEDVIVVTGTRIARDPNVGAPAPIQSVNSEAIAEQGVFNTVDVLNDLPSLLFSTTAETSNQDANPDGQSTLNLRGLGEDRTLTLVNGRRFVSGVQGAQSVDVGTIPQALIERVEVMTGGASAIYGADAVTGVVNFILRDDYEGLSVTARGGMSSEGDADQYSGSVLWGRNFGGSAPANVTLSLAYDNNPGLLFGDRAWAADNRVADDDANPDRRFQIGDIDGGTPSFSQLYDFNNCGRYPYGFSIPTSVGSFNTAWTNCFGGVAPALNPAEQALIDRAANAPSRAILPFHNFSISSRNGVIAPANFSVFSGEDVDNNGSEDCLDSYVGYNSGLDTAFQFGLAGGCWVPDPATGLRPYRDGLVAGAFNHFGGDGIENFFSEDILIPKEQRVTFTAAGHVDVTPNMTAFGEFTYSYHHVDTGTPLNTFYDLLYGDPANPFLPVELQTLANNVGGLFITRDPTDLGPNVDTNERRTFRTVFGMRGEFSNAWRWEVAANAGEFRLKQTDRNYVMLDRWFAAIDVVDGDPGLPVVPICRSESGAPVPPPTTIFEIPVWDSGFFTFTPGDGQCQPANIWAGNGGISQAAIDFITDTVVDRSRINQYVVSAQLTGDTPWNLGAGPIGFAVGAEYRKETSEFSPSSHDRGILPPGSPFAPGTNIADVSNNFGLGFAGGESTFLQTHGEYAVTELFGEINVPILEDAPFAAELSFDAAYRYSDYSSSGPASTWMAGLIWAPVSDYRFRTSLSQSVRAPNIFELFSPDQPAFFRPVDPCDVNELANGPPERTANCTTALNAIGVDPLTYTDPLSARFAGVISGNPDLDPEVSDTITIGLVAQPSFLAGFTFTVDYWNIHIEEAIAAPSSQDIVDNCYDSASFPNQYCTLFEREDDPLSAQHGGFRFLRQQQVNFGAIEAEGVDVAARYRMDIFNGDWTLAAQASHQANMDFFFDPGDPTAVDPELGEIFRPEWSGNFSINAQYGSLEVGYSLQYIGEQLLRAAEIETYQTVFGAAAEADAVILHDVSVRYDLNEAIVLFAGAENITDEEPYITEFSWPTGPRGRFFFLGLRGAW